MLLRIYGNIIEEVRPMGSSVGRNRKKNGTMICKSTGKHGYVLIISVENAYYVMDPKVFPTADYQIQQL